MQHLQTRLVFLTVSGTRTDAGAAAHDTPGMGQIQEPPAGFEQQGVEKGAVPSCQKWPLNREEDWELVLFPPDLPRTLATAKRTWGDSGEQAVASLSLAETRIHRVTLRMRGSGQD